eukprot:scaffold26857_cov75-Phaeocystis_antarctica.AAC.2
MSNRTSGSCGRRDRGRRGRAYSGKARATSAHRSPCAAAATTCRTPQAATAHTRSGGRRTRCTLEAAGCSCSRPCDRQVCGRRSSANRLPHVSSRLRSSPSATQCTRHSPQLSGRRGSQLAS